MPRNAKPRPAATGAGRSGNAALDERTASKPNSPGAQATGRYCQRLALLLGEPWQTADEFADAVAGWCAGSCAEAIARETRHPLTLILETTMVSDRLLALGARMRAAGWGHG